MEAKPPRPTALLKQAEKVATEMARFLREHKAALDRGSGAASVEDALKLADLVVALARHGQQIGAERVIETVSSVEIYLDDLETRLDKLLAETK